MTQRRKERGPVPVGTMFYVLLFTVFFTRPLGAQSISDISVLTNLQALVSRMPVGNPALSSSDHGPKGIVSADFDQDGRNDLAVSNTDGSVTVLFGLGTGRFAPPRHLLTVTNASLRGIVAADFNGDGSPDIAVAAPFQGQLFVFFYSNNGGPNRFIGPQVVPTWRGARNVEAGDFDGDGVKDLVVAGPNNGLRQYRSVAGGPSGVSFEFVTNVAALNFTFIDPDKFPKPLYSMKAFRPPGSGRDSLVATHAETTNVWLLAPNSKGALEIRTVVTGRANAHGLSVAPIFNPINSGLNDLVAVLRDSGVVEVHRGTNTPSGFAFHPAGGSRLRKEVPGGPRAVSIVDLNADGWNDVVVVLRSLDSILTYTNNGRGDLIAVNERPVGNSPRELSSADFNGDGRPDLAVMNRGSGDVTVLLAYEQSAGYRGVDNIYLVDGNVVGLSVMKFNNDRYEDVVQLQRASGDFSVRLANPDGTLQPPVYYTVGNVPAAQVLVDVNNDQVPDVVTANLGTARVEQGSVSVRLGNASFNGTLGPEIRIELPPEVEGRLFALVPGDFDKDGNLDLVAGFLDAKLAFFRGAGDGTFAHTRTRRIMMGNSSLAQPRSLTAADFDRDGDLDLAGLDVSGEMWVMENPGSPASSELNSLDAVQVSVQRYPAPGPDSFGGRKIIPVDYDHDGTTDLVTGSGKSAWLYRGLGSPGATNFATPPRQLAGISNLLSDFFLEDLDADGNTDLVLSCRDVDCISVFARNADGRLSTGLPFDAPSSRFIATGDLDGDGHLDLIGSGRVLWTSLSSRPPLSSPPLTPLGERPRLPQVVINEILASNSGLAVEADDDRMSEWVEVYNGQANGLSLFGWKMRLTYLDEQEGNVTNEFRFPSTAYLAPDRPLPSPPAHLLIHFSEEPRTLYHTGFKLPATGGTLTLVNSSGIAVDQVTYPPQRPNISYARYRDALRSFVFNPFPSPGKPNPINGTVEPTMKFVGVDPLSFQPGQPIRAFADVADDVGVSTLMMHYQTLGTNSNVLRERVQFFDDGQHGDMDAGDGVFGCELPFVPPVDTGTELQFFFELTDLNDVVIEAPEDPEFGIEGSPGNAYQLGFGVPVPRLEISEIVARNTDGIRDGTNGRPDWVEIRNLSTNTISMNGIALSQQMGDNPRYRFPEQYEMAPGEHFLVFCDNTPNRGTNHAPIGLNGDGDTIMLTGLTPNNSRTLIDRVTYGPQDPNVAWARLGAGGPFWKTTPTPTNGNIAPRIWDGADRAWAGQFRTNGVVIECAIGIPTRPGVPCTVEYSTVLQPLEWLMVERFVGDGIERVYTRPHTNAVFFRWRSGANDAP